jgi:hypothetical protein
LRNANGEFPSKYIKLVCGNFQEASQLVNAITQSTGFEVASVKTNGGNTVIFFNEKDANPTAEAFTD